MVFGEFSQEIQNKLAQKLATFFREFKLFVCNEFGDRSERSCLKLAKRATGKTRLFPLKELTMDPLMVL